MITALINILNTGTVVGVSTALITGFSLEVYRKKAERKQEQEKRYREEVLKPVLAFIDDMLILMSKAYWEVMDITNPDIDELIKQLRQKEAVIEARVHAIENEELCKLYFELDKTYISFRTKLKEVQKDGTEPIRVQIKEASRITGELIKTIYS